jgi:hypothetical protein
MFKGVENKIKTIKNPTDKDWARTFIWVTIIVLYRSKLMPIQIDDALKIIKGELRKKSILGQVNFIPNYSYSTHKNMFVFRSASLEVRTSCFKNRRSIFISVKYDEG